ncbi:PEP-CTERM sorting domain-containing protein [Chamaesiphon sp. VAR_69_metabat_338]|uniref:PEP-CTERM sorting domain-containing protein n=1 Tax=Chamaesiphon sp. VAR_69_metabat_338 TaxID=2964704 RepID=UPI00286EA73B|nr:PEP-CTERM sorting domain-containing protein [Chamaesiphon sp. VAR_69_metabat_338]
MKMTTRTLLSGVALSGATLAMAFGSVDRAQAASIGLGNTGVGTYSVTGGGSTTIVPNGAFPIGPWLANDATSSWIGSTSVAPGNYTYSTTFDLAGLNAGTALISGNWAGDNSGVSILLNGSATGISANAGSVNFASFTAFNIDSTANFAAGLNTLSFTINNFDDGQGNNPAGIRVAMTGSADASEVPEPSDFVGTAFAFGSVVLLKRKMSKKKLG